MLPVGSGGPHPEAVRTTGRATANLIVRALASILALTLSLSLFAAAPRFPTADPNVLTLRSGSGQFVVTGLRPVAPPAAGNPISTNASLLELAPAPLTVSCERVKQALLRELGARDGWRSQIHVAINPAMTNNQPVVIGARPYLDGWQYRVEVPPWISDARLARGLVQVLLLEMANRGAGMRSAEIPLWLSEGLTQHLMRSSTTELALMAPQRTVNRVSLHPSGWQGIRPDPLQPVRERLQTHAAFSFGRLGEVQADQLSEETWRTFQACAQLLVYELLQLPGGRGALQNMLARSPCFLNWQSAFFSAFQAYFPRRLDAEKWWSVVITHFTGLDPSQAWSPSLAAEKLEDTLRPPVLVSGARPDLPRRTRLPLQQLISEWDYLRQRPVLLNTRQQLALLRVRMPPEYRALADEYRRTLEDYLRLRDKSGLARAVVGQPFTSAERLAREAVKKLKELDQQRTALDASSAPAGNTLRPRQPVSVVTPAVGGSLDTSPTPPIVLPQ